MKEYLSLLRGSKFNWLFRMARLLMFSTTNRLIKFSFTALSQKCIEPNQLSPQNENGTSTISCSKASMPSLNSAMVFHWPLSILPKPLLFRECRQGEVNSLPRLLSNCSIRCLSIYDDFRLAHIAFS